MGVKYIDRALFYSPYYIGLCTSKKQFNKEVKRLCGAKQTDLVWLRKTSSAVTHQFVHTKNGNRALLVCIRKSSKESKLDVYNSLAHEATHCWQWIKGAINEPNPSEEFEAYAIGFITMRLIEAYKNA